MIHKRVPIVLFVVLVLSLVLCPLALAQYGGRPGDVIMYLLSYKGPGGFQVVPPTTVNDAQTSAKYRTLPLDSIVPIPSTPFPLFRQVLVDEPEELFQVGTDRETTIGIPRLVINHTKVFMLQGVLWVPTTAGRAVVARANGFIYFTPNIDLNADISLEDVKFLIFSNKGWPFIIPFEGVGPLAPPGGTGLDYLVSTPGLIRLPGFLPWNSLRVIYPGVGWPDGADWKLIDDDPVMGDTAGQLRLRPGRTTPFFRIPSGTHFVVLSGTVELRPAGGTPVVLKPRDYAYLPKNFAFSLSNPKKYDGPGAQ